MTSSAGVKGRTASPASEEHQRIIEKCQRIYYDVRLEDVAKWKQEDKSRRVVGYLPVYAPPEIFVGSGVRPIAVFGGGDQINVIRGDSYYQSYICHLPRSLVDLGLTDWRETLDGLVCPAICDVIRNVSGVWQVLFPEKLVYFLDVPQNFDPACGGKFYRHELLDLAERLCQLSGRKIQPASYSEAIKSYNKTRRAVRELVELRVERPHWVPAWEFYLVMRAGDQLPADEHTSLIKRYIDLVSKLDRPELDNARIMIVGGFCEQPPLNLIRTIERSGCYIVDDDFTLGKRFLEEDVEEGGDPFDALVNAYLEHSTFSSVKYEQDIPKTQRLVEAARQKRADGVLLMSPSFCDPSLLDRPHFQRALDEANIPYSALQYAENLGQFAPIREQTGTFAEAIKLWGDG
ncbi:MAG: benzoyl-CoA reductase subunit C [Candidatus Obscuribacterales bacterium]|nr:benzoyl-CoA reductase subunit C [Candidatus Obscuribacterales bacterium]